ncbi:hypothetical protein HYW74_04915 [Candidatus Pacearchaeota archaeon]|nr:hypothetical protein [Candidatus Pacearchaeota archaeon]
MVNVDEILKKYSSTLAKKTSGNDYRVGDVSREYLQFKQDMMPNLSRYEKMARSFGGLLKVRPPKKDELRLGKNLEIAHLEITPSEVISFSFFGAFITFFIGLIVFLGVFFYFGGAGADFIEYGFGPAGLFLFMVLIASMFVFYYIYSSPLRMSKLWRLKASSQMVPCILYIVVYMKHTSNLERAIAFASQHLQAPLALDLRKIFWDVETGKYSTIKESLDHYLESWQEDSLEFVEAFHLIESSLYEPSEARRIQILEKALQVILDGVYEKMLVFSRDVRSPLTNLYMLGIVLPTLGLALLPLASTLLQGALKSYHVFILFNLIIPFFVFYLTTQIMLKRPGGYGEAEILELNPDYYKYKSKKPYLISGLVALPLFILGLIPFLFQQSWFVDTLNLQKDYDFSQIGIGFLSGIKFFDFKEVGSGVVGPFGIMALILSLFIPLSIALFFSIAYKIKTKQLIKSRDDTKQLEQEFVNSLFQLGNRLGDGLPAEIAFARVAESTRGQRTENFFRRVNLNLQQAGMSLENAIFDQRRGAIIFFPSSLIATSMRILLESVKKGLKIAAQSLMSISEYIKNIQKVTQRLNDLLAEVVSDMKSNMVFLAPLLSGIVVGLAGMITFIINKLDAILKDIGGGGATLGFDISSIAGFIDINKIIPPYYLQVAIGLYIIEIVFILTNVLVIINSGEDKLKKTYEIGKNLKAGVWLYLIVTLFSVLALSLLAAIVLQGLGS